MPPGKRPDDAAHRRALLGWFDRHARPLPWREAPSPYAVWVSEVMLQQTQVAAVIPYYNRFIAEFPTAAALAAAPLERVLELWSGLGYYRRARMLHHTAREIVARFAGRFPASYDDARSLPGVGDYTARAVLSIAFRQPFAVLDGNVARVIARLTARRGNIHRKGFRRAVERDLESLLSRRRPGDFNQALMQLGQTVCLPRAPRCERCPLRSGCRALKLGRPEGFPSPRPRRAAELHHLAAAVLRDGGRVAVVRGLDDGLLGDLWNFPAAFGRTKRAARGALASKLARLLSKSTLFERPLGEVKHNITHRQIRVALYSVDWNGSVGAGPGARPIAQKSPGDSIRWLALSRFRRAAVSRLAQKIAAAFETQTAC